MIEAVNSVLSNTSATRVAAEQQSTIRSYSANPDKVQEVAKAPFVSPYISIDRNYNKAILQIRDSDTGDVIRQYPTEGQLKAYRVAQQFSDRQAAKTEVPATPSQNVPTSDFVPAPAVSQAENSVPEVSAESAPAAPNVPSVEQEA